jgi:hypothetical protein
MELELGVGTDRGQHIGRRIEDMQGWRKEGEVRGAWRQERERFVDLKQERGSMERESLEAGNRGKFGEEEGRKGVEVRNWMRGWTG